MGSATAQVTTSLHSLRTDLDVDKRTLPQCGDQPIHARHRPDVEVGQLHRVQRGHHGRREAVEEAVTTDPGILIAAMTQRSQDTIEGLQPMMITPNNQWLTPFRW
jgi:hypothetical protein